MSDQRSDLNSKGILGKRGIHSNMENWRKQFPILGENLSTGKPLTYLDSAATSLKPKDVVDVMSQFDLFHASSVHRGLHELSERATHRFEASRERVAKFLNAPSSENIVFTKGTTEAINLVAAGLRDSQLLKAGDRILLTQMEHHANIVPWQELSRQKSLVLEFVKLQSDGTLDLHDLKEKLANKPKVFSFVFASNVLGTINPAKEMCAMAKEVGCLTVVDAAQAVTYQSIDVVDLDCDFLSFSAHKLFGPFGLGVLFGKAEALKRLAVYQTGGAMIKKVGWQSSEYLEAPQKFEAGTPPITQVLGFHAALDFIESIGYENIQTHENDLVRSVLMKFAEDPSIEVYGRAQRRVGIVAFNLNGAHPSDVGHLLSQMGIAVRVGHHCAQPLMSVLGIDSCIRASFSVYNTKEDVQSLISGVAKAKEMLK